MPLGTVENQVRRYLERAKLPRGTTTHELTGDASVRRYVRVFDPAGDTRMLLVHPSAIDVDTLPFLNVADLLRRVPVPVPAVLGSEPDLGILVLEDLGDITLQQYLTDATPQDRRLRYTEAVTLIDRMQRRGRELRSSKYCPYGLAFDVEKLTWELNFCLKHFLVLSRSAAFTTDQTSALAREFDALAVELSAESQVLCHRDYHSRNLMWHDKQLYVIDFQDARLGPDTYDLVSLLRDSYVENTPEFSAEIVDVFLGLNPELDGAEFRRRLDVMSVQRHLKALGTFGYQTVVAGRTRYQDDIPLTLGYLRDVFTRHSRFDRLRRLLVPAVPELG